MKINPKINKRVNESVAECRKVIVNATIELMKKIAEPGQEVFFDKILIMHHFKGGNSETWLADRISYGNGRGGNDFFITNLGDDYPASSFFLSLDHLQTIYNEVRKIVLNH